MKHLCMGYIFGELHLDEAALNLYEKLHHGIFEHSIYIKSQIAKIYYSLRGEHLELLTRIKNLVKIQKNISLLLWLEKNNSD